MCASGDTWQGVHLEVGRLISGVDSFLLVSSTCGLNSDFKAWKQHFFVLNPFLSLIFLVHYNVLIYVCKKYIQNKSTDTLGNVKTLFSYKSVNSQKYYKSKTCNKTNILNMMLSNIVYCKLPSILYFPREVVDWQQQLSASAPNWEKASYPRSSPYKSQTQNLTCHLYQVHVTSTTS